MTSTGVGILKWWATLERDQHQWRLSDRATPGVACRSRDEVGVSSEPIAYGFQILSATCGAIWSKSRSVVSRVRSWREHNRASTASIVPT